MKNRHTHLFELLFYCGLILQLQACGGNESTKTTENTPKESKKEAQPKRFMMVTVGNSRIRTTPDLEGAVLERMKEKAVLEYVYDSTNFTTAIKLNGQNHEAHWYKVKSEAGNEGWVYGAVIEFLSEEENRRILALREDAEAQRAALGEEAGRKGKSVAMMQEAPKIDMDLVARYKSLLQQISPADPVAMTRAISLFESVFHQTESASADFAFGEFLQFHRRILQHYQSRINLGPYQSLAAEIKNYGSANMEMDATTRQLAANGITFGCNLQNRVYLKENVDFLLRRFLRLVSAPLREFLEQYATENEAPVMEADQIALPITELAAYSVFWDKFLSRYPHFPLKEQIAAQRKTYTSLLLNGTASQPVFSGNKKSIEKAYKEAYLVMQKQMGISPLIKSMQEYYKVLEAEKFTETERTASARRQLLDKL